ncbi:MAG TPA: hypothetical protein VGN37_10350 [Actinocatenispora sp.]
MSAGLSDRDVHALVSALGRGEEPRIAVVTAHADVPAGTKATLVAYEPDTDEPFTLRFGDGAEVAAPGAVLAVVPRGRADVIARTAGADDEGTTAPSAQAADGSESGTPEPAESESDAATTANGSKPGAANGSESGAAQSVAGEGAPAKRAAKAAKAAAKKPAKVGGTEVVITVTVAGDGATVEATHGTRKLVKGASLPVGAGHALAQLVNLEPVTAAVEAVIAEHRTAKEAEAEQLRSRLAELERQLAEYQDIDAPA